MEILIFLFKGMLTGLMAGFPAGPLGAIAVGEMIQGKIRAGFLKGMGAVLANFIYGLVVTFGIGFISGFLLQYQNIIRMAGSLLIILLGLSIVFRKQDNTPEKELPTQLSQGASFITGFFVSLTNPSKIFIYTAMISFWGLDSIQNQNTLIPLIMALGIAAGSFFWWLFFAFTAGKIRKKTGHKKSGKLNRVLGLVIICMGIYFFVSSLVNLLNAG